MISTAIIVAGVCAVICVAINAIKAFVLNNTCRLYKNAAFNMFLIVRNFVAKFNETYSNTRIIFYFTEDGTPVLDFEDVESETTEE